MKSVHSTSLPASLLVATVIASFTPQCVLAESISREMPPASRTVLRVARSADGLTFQDTGEVFMERASAPDVERIGGDRLIAVFDSAEEGSDSSRLSVSRSDDGGKTWSPRREIRIKGLRDGRVHVSHGDLVRIGRGSWHLYFAARYSDRGSARRVTHLIQSAKTRNGVDFVLDRGVRLRAKTKGDPYPMAVSFGRRIHLYFEEGARASSRSNARGQRRDVRHMISRGGDRFASLRSVDVSGVRFVGSAVPLPKGIRVYVTSETGIASFVSADGREWAREPGVRLDHGWDPAVTRLADGTFLMLYCDVLDEDTPSGAALVEAPPDEPENWQILIPDEPESYDEPASALAYAETDTEADTDADAERLALSAPSVNSDSLDEGEGEYQVALGVEDPEPADDANPEESQPSPDVGDEESGEEYLLGEDESPVLDEFDAPAEDGSHWLDNWDAESSDGFAPTPDFETKVDYVEWLREFGTELPEENAYDAYAALIDESKGAPEWPELNDMYHGDYEGPPMPWSAEDHPEWETTNEAMKDLLEKFREATEVPDYALRIDFSEKDKANAPGGQPLLMGLRLPHLSRHRDLSKANLANAWRVGDDGKVSPKRMLDAWRTALRGAAHMNQGSTLIEDLVGMAERAQVQQTALWALKRGVFSGADLEAALDTLRTYDQARPAMPKAMRGEHAFAMDAVQFMFAPRNRGEAPQPRRDRIESLIDETWFGDGAKGKGKEAVDRIAAMSTSDVHDTIDAFNTHYRELEAQLRIGYPDVRQADVDAAAERYRHRTPVTEIFLPLLGRAYQLQTREEAMRRATKLAYATHIFRDRNGRWPATLAELPAELGETMRTDPFSGKAFGYRVTEDGPIIYTVSENGIDDGGVHSPRWNDEVDEETGSDDYVFWPPQPK